MRTILVSGALLALVGSFLIYLEPTLSMPLLSGTLVGIGIGFIIGGMVGYASKGAHVKYQQKITELKELKQKAKENT